MDGGKLVREGVALDMEKKPIVRWQHNEGQPATPPPDEQEWVSISSGAVDHAAGLRLVFTSNERGSWWISAADLPAEPGLGSGPYDIAPIDVKEKVRAALKKAGKPVVD